MLQATAEYILFSEQPISDVPTLVQLLGSFGSPPNAAALWEYFTAYWNDIVEQQKASGCVVHHL